LLFLKAYTTMHLNKIVFTLISFSYHVFLSEGIWRRENGQARNPRKVKQEDKFGFTIGSTNAHTAAVKGDTSALLKIAETDPEQLHTEDINGWKPIHEAARAGHDDVIELLVNFGADINDIQEHHLPQNGEDKFGFTIGSTNAHTAAISGDISALLDIAETDPGQLHAVDTNGWKPIHEAARADHPEVIALLVNYGADVNDRTLGGKGGSPLHCAREEHGDDYASPMIELLISLGAEYIEPSEEF